MEMKITVPCSFGTESVTNYEIKKYVARDTEVLDGSVSFAGDGRSVAAANIFSRCGHRVYVVLAEFEADSFDRLYDGVFRAELEKFIPENGAFPVKGYSLDSKLSSVPACQRVIKKAAAERLKKGHRTGFLPENGQVFGLHFALRKNRFSLMLDTSGDGLHKRGYRQKGGTAPIKETLAARIADLARTGRESAVTDPFCGSGTLLIEAAMRAAGIAPGLTRHFAGESFPFISQDAWRRRRKKAESYINFDIPFRARGSDIDRQIIKTARKNAAKAGVSRLVSFSVKDVKDFVPAPGGITVTNPPYGERLADKKEAARLERVLGERFFSGEKSSCYVITSDRDFEKNFGGAARRKRKLYNGSIPCRLYMYF